MEVGHFDSTQKYYSLFPYRNPENVHSRKLPNSRWSHTAAALMHDSGIELVITGNQQSNKEVDWQKVFYVF